MKKIIFLFLILFSLSIAHAQEGIVLPMAKCSVRLEHLDLPSAQEADAFFQPKEKIVELVTLHIPLFIESLYVDAGGRISTTNYPWDNNKYYHVKSVGNISMGIATTSKFIDADTCYIFGAGWDTAAGRNKTPLPMRIGILSIDGKGLEPKQDYNTAHEYTQNIKGKGSAVKFKVEDKEYEDNAGYFLVGIDKLLDFRLTVVVDAKTEKVIFQAVALGRQNKWTEAADLISKAARATPEDYTLWNSAGVFYLKSAESENPLGGAVSQTSNLGQALSAFDMAKRAANFKSAAVENNLAIAQVESEGHSTRARERFLESLSLDDNFAAAKYNLALLEEYLGTKPVTGVKPPTVSSPGQSSTNKPVKTDKGNPYGKK